MALSFHKPVFNDALTETRIHQSVWYPTRASLIGGHLRSGQVKLVLTGHIHESRDETVGGVRYVGFRRSPSSPTWSATGVPHLRGRRRVG